MIASNKMGRPTKRTPEVARIVCDALRLGLSFVSAAGLAAVHPDTLREWRRASEADPDSDDFSATCEKARAEGKRFVVGKLIENVKAGNVTAQIFWLKTRTDEFREHRPDSYDDAPRRQIEFVRRGVSAGN